MDEMFGGGQRKFKVPFEAQDRQNEKIFQAKKIKATLDGVEFSCILGEEKATVKAPVLGEHQVSNILAAISGAVACGMSLGAASQAAGKIRAAKGIMQKVAGANGSVFIDDTFNNNPDAALAAISFMSGAKGRKILVFQPMIELGKYTDTSHREVGKAAGSVCDEIILTNKGNFEEFLSGVRQVSTKDVKVMSSHKVADYINKTARRNDTILFKGKEAGLVLRRINMVTR